MALPGSLPKDETAPTDFRSLSDADFAGLSTEDKFRHVRLGMRDLAGTLLELAAGTTAANQQYGAYQKRLVVPNGRAHGDE